MAFRGAVIFQGVQQLRVPPRAHLGIAELAHPARLDLAAQLLRHGLHAVADSQYGNAQLEHRLRCPIVRFLVGRHVAAGQDDAPGAEFAHERIRDVTGMNLAIDLCLAYPARDELRVLRAEIENQDLVVHPDLIRRGSSALP